MPARAWLSEMDEAFTPEQLAELFDTFSVVSLQDLLSVMRTPDDWRSILPDSSPHRWERLSDAVQAELSAVLHASKAALASARAQAIEKAKVEAALDPETRASERRPGELSPREVVSALPPGDRSPSPAMPPRAHQRQVAMKIGTSLNKVSSYNRQRRHRL